MRSPFGAAPGPHAIAIGGVSFEWGRRTYIMGIVNATPDSFSGDGVLDSARAAEQAARMVQDGADLIDIGAESTRPDFPPIDAGEEWGRLEPVLRAVRAAVGVPISVDTSKAAVAERAFDAGADALNDVRGLEADAALAPLLARRALPAIVMHNQRGRAFGGDVIGAARAGLEAAQRRAVAAGVDPARLIVDPGFGFGWRPEQNLEMLRRLAELHVLGRPILLGTSRKSTLGIVLGRPVEQRAWGTAATMALAVASRVDIVRVHDVAEMADVVRVADAVVRGWTPPSDA